MADVDRNFSVVTGAFGFTGRSLAQRLLAAGARVRTLTCHPGRSDLFGGRVEVAALDFDHPAALIESLQGAETLYNTYWIRFERGDPTFDRAVANTTKLLRAAEEAGVHRIVHMSVTNPNEASRLPYFRGKAQVEDAIRQSRLSYAILRPSLIFGTGDVLINNIAWFLRRFPVFAIPGSGEYRVQPIFVEDLAEMAVAEGQRTESVVYDAVGPERLSFNELVNCIAAAISSRATLIHLPPRLVLAIIGLLGVGLRDVVLTRGEIAGLMADLLVSGSPPLGLTRFSKWLDQNAASLGLAYASELQRHYLAPSV